MEIYRFETARFAIVATAEMEEMDPRDSFEFEDDIDFASSGEPSAWFCAKVAVINLETGAEIGADYIGGCSYTSFEDFTESHRHPNPAYRNTLATKARGINVCNYFPSMIAEAVAMARKSAAGIHA